MKSKSNGFSVTIVLLSTLSQYWFNGVRAAENRDVRFNQVYLTNSSNSFEVGHA
ncbi:hypothetical protein ACFSR6_04795 [Pedobacter vanadiisoli]|uniref:Uncharacterized protein n=1 Tax=Pedobacter vanadiisoli TaxID=1761975 RepID=A0ABW5MEX8_9SPHI